jgi:crotonobetainyl-CoA:carnitine CoA-transferase CaiB-like acyl-CoA transferase
VAQVNGWAVDGPLSERRAIDGAFQAMTGRCVGQGGDIEPRGFYGGLVDNATAMLVAAACVAALVDRQATGRGQQVATTLLGVAALVQSHRLVLTGGQAPALGRLGTDPIGRSQLARLFATSDGWIFVDADRDEDWSKLVHGGRVPADLERPSASDGAEAIADGPVARALLQWCVSMTTSQALAAFADLGVAAVPVHHLGDLPSVSRVTSSGALVAVDHPQWGALWHTGRLIRFSQPRSAVAPAR